jgi:excisionase family DNA binding protein
LIAAERVTEREEFLSVGDVAAMLRISPQTIRRHIREGKLPAARFGHFWRVRRSDLEGLFTMSE